VVEPIQTSCVKCPMASKLPLLSDHGLELKA